MEGWWKAKGETAEASCKTRVEMEAVFASWMGDAAERGRETEVTSQRWRGPWTPGALVRRGLGRRSGFFPFLEG